MSRRSIDSNPRRSRERRGEDRGKGRGAMQEMKEKRKKSVGRALLLGARIRR